MEILAPLARSNTKKNPAHPLGPCMPGRKPRPGKRMPGMYTRPYTCTQTHTHTYTQWVHSIAGHNRNPAPGLYPKTDPSLKSQGRKTLCRVALSACDHPSPHPIGLHSLMPLFHHCTVRTFRDSLECPVTLETRLVTHDISNRKRKDSLFSVSPTASGTGWPKQKGQWCYMCDLFYMCVGPKPSAPCRPVPGRKGSLVSRGVDPVPWLPLLPCHIPGELKSSPCIGHHLFCFDEISLPPLCGGAYQLVLFEIACA